MTVPDDQATPLQPAAGQGGDGQSNGTGAGTPAAVESLKIDGQEYTPDQVKEFIKAKTDYDQFQPVFTKQQQLLKDPQALRDYITKNHPDLFPAPGQTGQPGGLPPELQDAFKVLQEQGNFMTKEAASKMVQDALSQREADSFISAERSTLEKEWNGEGGKPKFDFEAVRQFAVENGYPSLTSAFKAQNEPALMEWYAANKVNPKAPTIARPGAVGVPVNKEKGPDLNSMGDVAKDFLKFADSQ
jgi:hypothetical protein